MAKGSRPGGSASIRAFEKAANERTTLFNDIIRRDDRINTDPRYYQYGEKDSRYIAQVDAVKNARDDLINHPEQFLAEDNAYNPRKQYKGMTRKAKADYEHEYRFVMSLIAEDARSSVYRDDHGQLRVKKKKK